MSKLAPGLLLAAPPLGDPNFDKSVVLLASHGDEGAFGWVLNGKHLMTLSDLLSRAEIVENSEVAGSVRIGGPVSQEQVWLVYPSKFRFEDVEGQFEVYPGITATASRKVLELIAEGNVPEPLICLAGYAGWGPDQLEDEIRRGSWLPTDVDPQIVFEVSPEQCWHRAYERVGTTPMAFTTRTVGSA
ncbi:MAG: YqgE/AlgH family protein [Polyangiaceae bacterium]|nr:YqgE/AlgH family protein [Polyangiaceae bacterium]